jgi:hypothetical protein
VGKGDNVNEKHTDHWITKSLPGSVSRYETRDTSNVHETAPFYSPAPETTLTLKGETCTGHTSKEWLIILLCCNADGTEEMKPYQLKSLQNPGVSRMLALFLVNIVII